MLGLACGCTTTGGATGPSDTPSLSAPTAPSASPSLHSSREPLAVTVHSPTDAIAAVVAQQPGYAGHVPLVEPGETTGPIIGPRGEGHRDWVFVREDGSDFLVTFVTGTGDCASGCTDAIVDTFRVTPDGTVTFECTDETARATDGGAPRSLAFPTCQAPDR